MRPRRASWGSAAVFGPDTFAFPRSEALLPEGEGLAVATMDTGNLDTPYPTNVLRRKDLVAMRLPITIGTSCAAPTGATHRPARCKDNAAARGFGLSSRSGVGEGAHSLEPITRQNTSGCAEPKKQKRPGGRLLDIQFSRNWSGRRDSNPRPPTLARCPRAIRCNIRGFAKVR